MDSKDDRRDKQDQKWNHINSELKNALDTWTDLTERLEHEISPEEKQLQEIKTILSTLKTKLKEFNEL
jgi:chromosome segregation ATPase